MAKLNKKVAIIGIIVIVLLVGMIGGALLVQTWRKSPKRYVGKAEALMKEIKDKPIDLENEDLMEKYSKVAGYYVAAFSNTKDVQQQVGYLQDAIEVLKRVKKWDSIVGCWNKMITVDAKNWQARRNIIDYLKKRAESGEVNLWSHIETNISDLIEAQQKEGIQPDPYLYFLKGKALYFSGMLGTTADAKSTITQAIELMEQGIDQEPEKIKAEDYDYLAKAILELGRLQANTGVLNANENAKEKAHQVINEYISKNPNDPNGYIHDLSIDFTGNREQLEKLEEKVLDLSEKFPNAPAVYYAQANYYNSLGNKKKALQAMEKAHQLAPEKIEYIMGISKLSFDNYTISKNTEFKQQALEYGQRAISHPDTQETAAITKAANRNRKLNSHNMLAQFYIDLAMQEQDQTQKKDYLEKAQENIHQIKQIITSPDSVMVLKWDGLYNLASGNRQQAKLQLYKAYEKMKTSQQSDAFLSYNLAKIFENTNEQGLFLEYINDALKQQDFLMTRPDVLMEYLGILTNMAPSAALNGINTYETFFGTNQQITAYKFRAYLATNQQEKAKDILETFEQNDPNRISGEIAIITNNINQNLVTANQLNQQIKAGDEKSKNALESVQNNIQQLRNEKFQLVEKMLETNPQMLSNNNYSEYFNYHLNNQNYEKARLAAQTMAKAAPDNILVKTHLKRLNLGDPNQVTTEQSKEIAKEVFTSIEDPLRRNLSLAEFYLNSDQQKKAVETYNQVLEIDPDNAKALVTLFDIAMNEKDMERLKELANLAQKQNIDNCQGLSYFARIDTVNENYDAALDKLNKCIEENPLDSLMYYLRSKVYIMKENYEAALQDAKITTQYSPFNPSYSKNLALVTYQRNQNLGDNVTTEQRVEARNAIQSALSQNKNDMQLLSLYVDSIGALEPEKAIAILQSMQAQNQSVANDIQIGMLSLKIATESNPPLSEYLQKPFFEIAEASLSRAVQAQPDNQNAVKLYVRLLQETDRADEAQKLLKGDENLLWQYYFQNGQYEQAKEILDRLYQQDPNQKNVLNGLVLIAEQTENKEKIIKYTRELIDLDPENLQSHLIQIRSYIQVNMINEAKNKIDSLIQRGEDDPRVYMLDALVHMRNSKLDLALETTNTALVKDPESAQGWRLKGQINAELGNFEQAIEALKQSKALNDTPEVRISLAQAYLQTNQQRNAITELETAIENPQAPLRAWLILEDIYRRGENQYEIREFYNKAAQKFDSSPLWFNKYANYLYNQENYQRAAELYLDAWEISQPNGNIDSFSGYMNSLIDAQNYNQAVSFASKHIDGNYAVPALLYIGNAKYESGDQQAAKEFFNKAIDRSIDSYPQLNNCINLIKGVDSKLAQTMFTNRYETKPQSSQMNFAMAIINLDNQNYNKTLDYIEKAISLENEKTNKINLKNYKLNALQQAYSTTKDKKYLNWLIDLYKEFYQLNPNNPEILNNLSYMLASKDMELQNALQYAEKAMQLVPNNPGIMDTYGYVLIKLEKYQQALEQLIRAKQLFEKASANAPAEFYYHYAVANEKRGKKDIALISYKKALEINENQLSETEVNSIEQSINKLENM